ncbi:MAG: type II toxin-antitoxin system VapC family toxin [Chloroflexi bacterium]|nr:type II toxin-antitoxin system VapC family toxin [Chloroflexota bacterium]
MITAVDTSILIDVLTGHPDFGEPSADILRKSRARGSLVVCDVVWAETAGWFRELDVMRRTLDELTIDYRPVGERAATAAGEAWRRYREAGGPRDRLIADFLIGAHAEVETDQLLTRDRGFFRRYFRDLTIVDPTVDPTQV